MMYVHVFQNVRDCIDKAIHICEEYKKDIPVVEKRNLPIIVKFKNSDREYYIMTPHFYKTWCMGRTYMMDGKLYHSGQRITFER